MPRRALSSLIDGELDPSATLQHLADRTRLLVEHADGASVLLWSEAGLRAVACSGTIADRVGETLSIGASLAGLAIRGRALQRSHDVSGDARVAASVRDDPRVRSALVAPLLRSGEVVGALSLTAGRCGAFDDDDDRLLALVAEFASVSLAAVVEAGRAARHVLDGLSRPVAPGEDGLPDACANRVSEFFADMVQPGAPAALRSRRRIAAVIAERRFTIVGQPIVELDTGRVRGVEALARFTDAPYRPPNLWFDEGHAAGLGRQLQEAACLQALALVDELPGDVTFGINISYDLLTSGRMPELLRDRPCERLYVELTEHRAFDDYAEARSAIAELRRLGVRVAIDDVGAGYSSFHHVIELAPDTLKLDRFFVEHIETDRGRRAMAEALVMFARRMGIHLIAEGIETDSQLRAVRELGVPFGQGFLIARPAPVTGLPRAFDHVRCAGGVRTLASIYHSVGSTGRAHPPV